MKMNKKQFSKYLARDKHCYHCGLSDDTLVPNHRINRGMGGSKTRDRPSNIVVMCSIMNGLIESSGSLAEQSKWFGWKLESWEDPLEAPIYDVMSAKWYLFDDNFGRKEFEKNLQN
jgi:hypothetical protein